MLTLVQHKPRSSAPNVTALRRMLFAVNKSTYTEEMTVIKNNIADIESLVDRSIEMAPKRELRSRGRSMQLLHELAGSVYCALLSSLPGSCSHEVYLKAMMEAHAGMAYRSDEEVLKNADIHLAMNFSRAGQLSSVHPESMWEDIVIRHHKPRDLGHSVDVDKLTGNAFIRAVLDSHEKVDVESPNPIVNLCEEICRRQKHGGTGCYGEINHETREFRVYPGKYMPCRDSWNAVALQQVLEDPIRFSGLHGQYMTKRKLAIAVSAGFLQFHQTNWLPDVITSLDVWLLEKDSLLRYNDAFLMATLPELHGRSVGQMRPSFGCRNPALVSLGILLAELGCGKTMESMRNTDEKAMLGVSRLMCDRLTAHRVLRHELGGTTYANAVRCCIEEEFIREHLDLTDQDFRQEVYERVVRPIEDEHYAYM